MANPDRLEEALRNAHAAGDTAAARKLAAALREASMLERQLEAINGPTAPPVERPDPTVGDYVNAAGTVALGAVTSLPALAVGSVEGITGTLRDGTFGTYEGAREAARTRDERMASMTYMPSSPGAQEVLRRADEASQPLQYLTDPLAPFGVQGAVNAPQLPLALRYYSRQSADTPQVPSRPGSSAGAAETGAPLARAESAAQTPIPMTGDRAPTLGQVTRDQVQLRKERELAKNDAVGEPLRARYDAQVEGLNQNLDAIEQQFDARRFDDREIGQATAAAVDERKAAQYETVQAAYRKAEEAGELEQPTTLGSLDELRLETQQLESLAPNAMPIYKEAQRLGVLDAEGNTQQTSLANLERLRQFVNKASDPADRQQNRFRRLWTGVIDDAIDQTDTGPLYKDARRRYSSWVQEFEETPITANLIRTKRGTNERAVAYEDVFKKTLLGGSLDEINKLRGTLLRTDAGKEAWTDMKGRFARYIGDQARTSNTTSNDQPIISPYKLGKTIDELDRTGKLESIFGKNGAAEIRNVRETAQSMLTVPPGTVNSSGTSAELYNMLMRAASGVPVLRRLPQYIERSGMRRDVEQSLQDPLETLRKIQETPQTPEEWQEYMARLMRQGR